MEYFSWPDRRSEPLFQAQNSFMLNQRFHLFARHCFAPLSPQHWYRENGYKPWKDGAL